MSYQVIARKWRPKSFAEVVGQAHVLRALINALEQGRLHHAYLFTGTRGVGKTTLARILARSLNCEQGVSSTPCGVCGICQEINDGRFVDLIEVDAASRTKVEDTRDLLENVPYAPARGRYKVYLIDEVHMLSTHSFNALLKTLEEPPAHVKFLLATTDPQRLPVTVLSRCLQFNLKRLDVGLIAGQMHHILTQEGVASEAEGVAEIARAADGSLRDALSLLDQAIAYGGGRVLTEDVRTMLGTVERARVLEVAQALARGDAQATLEWVARLVEDGRDLGAALSELVALWHRLALAQVVPAALAESEVQRPALLELATRVSAEEVQLYYQIGVLGRRDLLAAPDLRTGLEMTLLRMLAFRPMNVEATTQSVVELPKMPPPAVTTPVLSRPLPTVTAPVFPSQPPPVVSAPAPVPALQPVMAAASPPDTRDWPALVDAMRLEGMARQLAMHCTLRADEGATLYLALAPTHASLRNRKIEERMQQALSLALGRELKLVFEVAESGSTAMPSIMTPAMLQEQRQTERQEAAVRAIHEDPGVQALTHAFDAHVVPESIRPV